MSNSRHKLKTSIPSRSQPNSNPSPSEYLCLDEKETMNCSSINCNPRPPLQKRCVYNALPAPPLHTIERYKIKSLQLWDDKENIVNSWQQRSLVTATINSGLLDKTHIKALVFSYSLFCLSLEWLKVERPTKGISTIVSQTMNTHYDKVL